MGYLSEGRKYQADPETDQGDYLIITPFPPTDWGKNHIFLL
jgi:hypothetical protein